MDNKWNEEAGDSVYVFAGNFITGESQHLIVPNDYDQVEETVYGLLGNLGWDNCVWATYNSLNSEESCTMDFNNYMAFRQEKYAEECAA